MTKTRREQLKGLIDAEVRRRTEFIGRACCSECGGEHDNVTLGCKRCWDRNRNRQRRAA